MHRVHDVGPVRVGRVGNRLHNDDSLRVSGTDGVVQVALKVVVGRTSRLVDGIESSDGSLTLEVLSNDRPEGSSLVTLLLALPSVLGNGRVLLLLTLPDMESWDDVHATLLGLRNGPVETGQVEVSVAVGDPRSIRADKVSVRERKTEDVETKGGELVKVGLDKPVVLPNLHQVTGLVFAESSLKGGLRESVVRARVVVDTAHPVLPNEPST